MNLDECIKKKLVIKKSIDKETANSLKKLAEIRLNDVEKLSTTTLKVESYYEIIKELITAFMALNGYKSYSHECLISFLFSFSKDFESQEINLIDQLRVIRNDIGYRGAFVDDDYLKRNKEKILKIINKLNKKI